MVRKYQKLVDPTGYKGGNLTRGPNRKGYRGGRKPRAPGQILHTASQKLTDQEYATAVFLGVGNVSAGVRLALSLTRPFLGPYVQDTKYDAETNLEQFSASIQKAVKRAEAFLSELRARFDFSLRAEPSANHDAATDDNDTPWDDMK